MKLRHRLLALSTTAILFAFPAMAEDFSETIAYAYAHHPAIKAEEEQLEATRTTIREAFGGFLPTAVANYDKGRKRFNFENTPEDYTDTKTRSLTVTQPIFQGGGTLAQLRSARSLTKAEEARLHGVEQDVLLRAITAYAQMVQAVTLRDINQDNVSLLERHMNATRTRKKAKDLTVTDVALSEARYARAQADLSRSEGDYDAAKASYIREIGLKPDATVMPPMPPWLPKNEEEVASLAANNPALAFARHQEDAADSNINARIANLLPTVNLQGSMDRREGITTVSTALSNVDEDWVMMRVSVPLYQGGGEYARLSQARHRYQKARNDTTDTVRDTLETALRAWHNYNAVQGTVDASRRADDAAKNALGGIQEEYKYGTRTVLDMLDTQQELFAARTGLIRAETQQVINAYSLLASVGKLDPETLNLDIAAASAEQVSVKKEPAAEKLGDDAVEPVESKRQ